MPYPALPARARPYHNDGTVVKWVNATFAQQITLNTAQALELNNENYVPFDNTPFNFLGTSYLLFFFPERIVLAGMYALCLGSTTTFQQIMSIEGSANSTNGLDGTWASASAASGYNGISTNIDSWRADVRAHVLGAPVNVLRVGFFMQNWNGIRPVICHVYANKASGETQNDIIFLDAANDAEFGTPLDFGDQPAGTTLIRELRIRNTSATLTANNITVSISAAYHTLSTNGVNYGSSFSIASLGPNTTSGIFFLKSVMPNPPTSYLPFRAPLMAWPASWS